MARIIGDDRDIVLIGTVEDDVIEGRGGDDLLFGRSGRNRLLDDGPVLGDVARGGGDRLFDGTEGDLLIGDAGTIRLEENGMLGRATGGADRLFGNAGDDWLLGDGDVMPHAARGGADCLDGGAGDDRLYGDAGPTLGDLTDVTRGADRFVFARGSDRDAIFDFENNKDAIDLSPFAGIDGIDEVRAQARQVGTDTVIDLGAAAGGTAGEDVLTLAGFDRARLNTADFLFA